jgi:alpha-glucosidase
MVPTAWDETRFIDGTPGTHIVLARRKGKQWYIGAMTNEQARSIEIPLSLLGKGKYEAAIWQDGATANDVDRTVSMVSDKDKLPIRMSRGGGAAIVLTPAN